MPNDRPRTSNGASDGSGKGGMVPAPPRDGVEAERLSTSDADQTRSDADQTTADADQSAADQDQALADQDERQAVADQHASERDQAASDSELRHHPEDEELRLAHKASRVERQKSTLERDATSLTRARTATERLDHAARRDHTAKLRDLTAIARDRAAEARDRAASEIADELPDRSLGDALRYAAEVRVRAAEDRARAAEDRAKAAADREHAARDREEALAALEHADVDDLTGAFRREIGDTALRHAIDRARRSGSSLAIVFVDVDGLKKINDEVGHAEGDRLLQAVVATIRSRMRSYEPIVRYGGDEFVCALGDLDYSGATRRFNQIKRALEDHGSPGSISVGIATMRAEDDIEDLVARADQDLIRVRG